MNISKLWRSWLAGLCGSAGHSCLMFFKSRFGVLPTFQPYEDLQQQLSKLIGSDVHPAIPWVLSFFNGAIVLGYLFGRIYPVLPGKNGVAKGFVFGFLSWIVMGLLFFPLLGLGVFATHADTGVLPAFFSLLMLLTYSIIMAIAYSALVKNEHGICKPRHGRL
jgi:uncharacterized protein DUF6789